MIKRKEKVVSLYKVQSIEQRLKSEFTDQMKEIRS